MSYSSLLIAQSEKVTNWLTPVWVLSVGITIGLILVALFVGLFWLLSRVPGLNELDSTREKRNIFGSIFSVIAAAIMISIILWRYFSLSIFLGSNDPSNEFYQHYVVWILLALVAAPAIGFGLVPLLSKTRSAEILGTVKEGFLFWVSWAAGGMAVFCLIGYFLAMFDGFGVINFVDAPNDKLESVGRMPYTGQFKKKITIEKTPFESDPQIVDMTIWGFELKYIEVMTDQRLLISTIPLSSNPDADDVKLMMDIPAADEKFIYNKRPTGDTIFVDDVTKFDKLYIRNMGRDTADVTLWWKSEPLYPEATVIPFAAFCVAGLYIGYFLLTGAMPKIAAISLSTFKNEISQPIFILLFVIGFVFILASIYIPYNTLGEDIKMYKEGGLTFIRVLAIFLAVWSASKSVAEEIEGRTALTVLSKPVGRRQFIVGKFGGIGLAVGLLFILLGLWFVIWVSYKPIYDAKEMAATDIEWQMGFQEAMRIIPGLLLGYMEVLIFVAISVAISTRMGILPNFLICFALYVMGHLTPLIIQSNEVAGAFEPVQLFGRVIAIVIPVLDHFDIQAAIMGERAVPMDYVGWCMVYCLMYGAMALLFALVMFEDRDLA